MKISKLIISALICGVIILVQGCMVAAVGVGAAGTVAYVKGDLESVEAASLDDVYSAAEKAVDELGLFVISKKKDALSATIITRDTADKKIKIYLASDSKETTKIFIRVGIFGDEAKSRLVYDKIKEYLQK